MVGAEYDAVQIGALLSQQCRQLSVDVLHILHAAHTAGYHRLVRHHNGQIAGAVQQTDRLCRAGLQLQLLRGGDESAVLIDRAVPVEKYAFLLFFQIAGGYHTALQLAGCRSDALRRTHVLDILRGQVGVYGTALPRQRPENLLFEVGLFAADDASAQPLVHNVKAGVDAVVIPVRPRIVLGEKAAYALCLVPQNDIGVKGVGVGVYKQSGRSRRRCRNMPRSSRPDSR